jgi:hypothetical protein
MPVYGPQFVLIWIYRPKAGAALREARWRAWIYFCPGPPKIARAVGVCHGCSSSTLWRHAGSLANAGVADERVRGRLIKRSRPLKAVALLESQDRALCRGAYCAVERAIIEPQIVKLYLCPSDVSFERLAAFTQWCEAPGAEVSTAFGTLSASAEKSRAAPPIPNTSTEAVPRISFLIIVISRVPKVNQIVSYYSEPSRRKSHSAGSCVRFGTSGRGPKGRNRFWAAAVRTCSPTASPVFASSEGDRSPSRSGRHRSTNLASCRGDQPVVYLNSGSILRPSLVPPGSVFSVTSGKASAYQFTF